MNQSVSGQNDPGTTGVAELRSVLQKCRFYLPCLFFFSKACVRENRGPVGSIRWNPTRRHHPAVENNRAEQALKSVAAAALRRRVRLIETSGPAQELRKGSQRWKGKLDLFSVYGATNSHDGSARYP
jgi:hypothetical protein